jgi:hypothetical protein
LDGFVNLPLFLLRDIVPNRLRRALHRFGGHFQSGQDFHLLAAAIEGRSLADHGIHAAHTGREFGFLDVQFDIDWELADMALGAQVVGPQDSGRAHDGLHRLGAEFFVLGMVSTRARQLAPIVRRDFKLKQFG